VKIAPDELANTCAVFAALGTNRIPRHELEASVRKSLLLHSSAGSSQIIAECKTYKLLDLVDDVYVLTPRGRSLAKLQGSPRPVMNNSAREFVLKRVYLNPGAPDRIIGQLLSQFRPDVARRTFVFDRRLNDSDDTIEALQKMNAVGLLDIGLEIALVRREYLGLVNDCLMRLREGPQIPADIVSPEAQAIGRLAEEKALDHERHRLTAAGYPELALLVQQISLVDQSAGYDILSYRGATPKPENPIYIEVKGTTNRSVSFTWSRNERVVAGRERRAYWLYIYTSVDLKTVSATGPVRISDAIVSPDKMGYNQDPSGVYVTQGTGLRMWRGKQIILHPRNPR